MCREDGCSGNVSSCQDILRAREYDGEERMKKHRDSAKTDTNFDVVKLCETFFVDLIGRF